ncbi:hypothetical protein D2S45_09525 [Prevotella intermedia]|uniref:Uncharacterized protein n=2 Tax=Prevotella intermedia TaxID=28131 RepID=A0A3R8G6R7_PREIN|nr:hypothetical protein D2S53_09275 [Prevotella intermedia]RRF86801.1 hypothetical protein D2S45_09525 [Prevotella intermedia]
MYTEVTNKPTNIVSFSSNTKTTNNFNYQRSKSTTAIVGHTFQYLLGSETDPKLASFDNDAFSLKLSLNLQFISATRVKVYMRPIMKKNQLTAIVGGDSYSSSFNSALKSMTDECKAKDETVSYTYKNGIVKLKSNIVGDRT